MYDKSSNYDFDSDEGDFLAASVNEGFAQANVLRYAIYRFGVGTYDADLFGGRRSRGSVGYRHGTNYQNGEETPSSFVFNGRFVPNAPQDDAVIFHRPQWRGQPTSRACFGSPGTVDRRGVREAHDCGSILELIYWELAWNQLRTGYKGYPAGNAILTTSEFVNDPQLAPHLLLDEAYTFAIVTSLDSSGPEIFFDAVSAWYIAYLGAREMLGRPASISQEEIDRVRAVLNHHCVGFGDGCSEFEPFGDPLRGVAAGRMHKLPGSKLPAAFAMPADFANNDNSQHLVRGSQMTLGGAASLAAHPTADGQRYARLVQAGDSASFNVALPVTGTYRIFGAVSPGTGGCAGGLTAPITLPPMAWDFEPSCAPGGWRWRTSPFKGALAAGSLNISLSHLAQDSVGIDALLIRRCPPEPTCDPTIRCGTVDDLCGGTIECPPCAGRTVIAGAHHTCATKPIAQPATGALTDMLECWGDNAMGQLGANATNVASSIPRGVELTGALPSGQNPLLVGVEKVRAGWDYTCALTDSGDVFCWGDIADGTGVHDAATQVTSGLGVVDVDVGNEVACIVLPITDPPTANVRCWGSNMAGQLGDGTTSPAPFSAPATAAGIADAVAVATGGLLGTTVYEAHVCALSTTGEVRCWGTNGFGQLGDGTLTAHATPALVPLAGVAKISAGGVQTIALRADGEFYVWGSLSTAPRSPAIYTQLIQARGGSVGLPIIEIDAGGFDACGLVASDAQDGIGCFAAYNPDAAFSTVDTEPKAFSLGLGHGCVVDRAYRQVSYLPPDRPELEDRIRCWGANSSGQLGNGTFT